MGSERQICPREFLLNDCISVLSLQETKILTVLRIESNQLQPYICDSGISKGYIGPRQSFFESYLVKNISLVLLEHIDSLLVIT